MDYYMSPLIILIGLYRCFVWTRHGVGGLYLNITIINHIMVFFIIRYEITGLFLLSVEWPIVEAVDLKWTAGGFIVHYFGGSGGVCPWASLNWLFFIWILLIENFSPLIMQESSLCPGYTKKSQITHCIPIGTSINGRRDD